MATKVIIISIVIFSAALELVLNGAELSIDSPMNMPTKWKMTKVGSIKW